MNGGPSSSSYSTSAAPAALTVSPRLQAISGGVEEKLQLSFYHAIVKIYTVHTTPSFAMPWQKNRQTTSTASGFVISGRRILTNAHGVKYFSNVRVRKHGDSKKYPAKVLHVGHDCDLAMVTVEEEEFWQDVQPLEIGGVPSLQESVICVGYPTGGDNISVTKGVVSRVDVSEYSHAGEYLLAIQIDAAINAGNSGGPAILGDKVVGVAFETLEHAENIGYVIPVPIIQHFLQDIERHGEYTGFCSLGFSWQPVENSHLRKYLKMANEQHGILINKLQPLSHAAAVLQPFDVLTAISDVPIADDGTIEFRNDQRIAFRYIVSQCFRGDECKLTIIRAGQIMDVVVKVENPRNLVPVHLFDKLPSYYIYAGLVFSVLSRPFLHHEYGKSWARKAPIRLCDQTFYGIQTEPDEQVVVLNQVLVDEVNVGYQNLSNTQVMAVNGIKLRNLRHLMDIIEEGAAPAVPFVRFDLDREKVIIIERTAGLKATAAILENNMISSHKSKDLHEPVPGSDHANANANANAIANTNTNVGASAGQSPHKSLSSGLLADSESHGQGKQLGLEAAPSSHG